MTIEEMKQRKIELGYSYEQISLLSGVPVGTVQKIFGGVIKSPRYETLRALEETLNREAGAALGESAEYSSGSTAKSYTISDYDAISADRRIELIDGVIYDMGAPTYIHQMIAGQLYRRIYDYIDRQGGDCIPLQAPLDVQLNCDDRTVVQPDIMIVCSRDKFREGRILGAPDFVAEILSESTKKKDLTIKLGKYTEAGVREYWIIDPDKKRILVYDLKQDADLSIHGFHETVPMGIFQGLCEINFTEIYESIKIFHE